MHLNFVVLYVVQIFEAKTRSKPKKRIRKGLVDTTTPNIATAITQEEEITDELLQRTLNLTEAPKYLITLREPPTTVFQQPQEVYSKKICFVDFL